VIRQTKFAKSRLVPFGPRVEERIRTYLSHRERYTTDLQHEDPLLSFSKDKKKPLYPKSISHAFHELVGSLQLTVPAGVATPRAHHLSALVCRWHFTALVSVRHRPGATLDPLIDFLGTRRSDLNCCLRKSNGRNKRQRNLGMDMPKKQLIAEALIDLHRRLNTFPTRSHFRRWRGLYRVGLEHLRQLRPRCISIKR
jgi:hypothetical protein